MDVFRLRDAVIGDYNEYISSFLEIKDERIREEVENRIAAGVLWPQPLLQLNPSFDSGGGIDDLVGDGLLHGGCKRVFRVGKSEAAPQGQPMQLYWHQAEAVRKAASGRNYVLTTGTGSGKSLSYIVPIVDHVLRNGSGRGIQAVIVYPMNALANSQEYELKKFLGSEDGEFFPVTFHRYTGQERDEERRRIIENPPDILLTNYVMLELILTRPYEHKLVEAMRGLKFLVFDELHTYRGRQGADVAMLIRRLRETLTVSGTRPGFICVGTSATLAGEGSFEDRQASVATIATRLFGAQFSPGDIIGEKLRPETGEVSLDADSFREELRAVLLEGTPLPEKFEAFIRDPLAVWIENRVGLETKDGRLCRCSPRPIKGRNGLSEQLARETGIDAARCEERLKEALLAGSRIVRPDNGKPVFAFKLHQFVSKGDTVYATLEPEDRRALTLFEQRYAPGRDDSALLYPLRFCRECGKEFYCAHCQEDRERGTAVFSPDQGADADAGIEGYLFIDKEHPWPDDEADLAGRVPDEWYDEDRNRLADKEYRKKLPASWFVFPDGTASRTPGPGSVPAWFMSAPLAFCPNCQISYRTRLGEFSKLATLGTEGRSSATTVLSLSMVTHLRKETDLDDRAMKFLCFTDNRQDASLQAGHFNDFNDTCLVRSALCNALQQAGPDGIPHENLPLKVFAALGLGYGGTFPRENYARNPQAKFGRAKTIDRAFLDILEYRLLCDLERGWRIYSPNLEQCGLLEFTYADLTRICEAREEWRGNQRLYNASSGVREQVSVVLLDHLRGRLAIEADVLSRARETAKKSREELVTPWLINEDESLREPSVAYPFSRGKSGDEDENGIYLSGRSSFGLWLNRRGLLGPAMKMDEREDVIGVLMATLNTCGILDRVPGRNQGYRIAASTLIWKPGSGKGGKRDPLRVRLPEGRTSRPNSFFVRFYENFVKEGCSLCAREHTAQVSAKDREEREEQFRKAILPILYCSPTMELGVDISQLNAVGMRSVPPTPANYAQRSGRAGRSGQPALVLTYCARGNSHDQHFFRHPGLMVDGSVTPPRIDLANEDLIRAHVHALWLAASGLDLKTSLGDILDITQAHAKPCLNETVRAHLDDRRSRDMAALRAGNMLRGLGEELRGASWYTEDTWLKDTLDNVGRSFEKACRRWQDLYCAARQQHEQQDQCSWDSSLPQKVRKQAERLRDEAQRQLDLLKGSDSTAQADFYSYRYFACEGFLPGYNFPRLPLSAYIPGRERDGAEYISRPRFLAISEFGPGSIIYHEGARYVITRVIMEKQADGTLASTSLKRCRRCGWVETDVTHDLCEICGERLPDAMESLFRMKNVSTRRRQRITSDEEVRRRAGYEIVSGYRFESHGGNLSHTSALLTGADGTPLMNLRYGHGATLWRINMGWANRKTGSPRGFLLDTSRGKWIREGSSAGEEDLGADDGMSSVQRVIPYVEDHKNCLVLTPCADLGARRMLSLQAAVKQAVQLHFQLEDAELSAQAMPGDGDPRCLLFVEASEGGAGVLRSLVEDGAALPAVAARALDLCHFDRDGRDRGRAEHAEEDCVLACYDCLMNYGNQRVHRFLDRHSIRDLLLAMADGTVERVDSGESRKERFERLLKTTDSELERDWLRFLMEYGLALPDEGQVLLPPGAKVTRADFLYREKNAAVFVDGPWHDLADRRRDDMRKRERLESEGFEVISFRKGEQWLETVMDKSDIFGNPERRKEQ